ncbi:L-arabinose isomerase [Serratia plymuthica]|uniref:L-arabinose isomerase n=1 Tax=Serratia plymuthica TaxID=82996 RepID=A0A2X4UU63_SERPL|nr:L-arabinose isomerase [Serratia plymuthica]
MHLSSMKSGSPSAASTCTARKPLQQVKAHAEQVVESLNREAGLPVKLVLKPLVTTPDEITALCRDANYRQECIGIPDLVAHLFAGQNVDRRAVYPQQTAAAIPYPVQCPGALDSMDMDFMNLNQTAHGGREFGFIGARMRQQHSVVAGHWQDPEAHRRIAQWMRAAAAKQASRQLKVARFGDNMREVAVTEGDKVGAQIQFGYSVNAYGIGDLVSVINEVSRGDVDTLIEEYEASYVLSDAAKINGEKRENLIDAARIELGMKRFLEQGNFQAFTTNFEDLHGMKQLPGLAVQRLMQQGYGFGGEGDWKTAALLRILKVMADGLNGGTSFMEDYTYHFQPGNDLVVGSHMLEVCPSIAKESKPLLDIQPLGIGGKADPARLIFSTPAGPAVNASLIDMGDRFRLLVNQVDTVEQPHPLPKLPVARAIWRAQPTLATAAEAWILAGGAHHTVFSQALDADQLRLYAEMHNIEFLLIDNATALPAFKNEIRWNEAYYQLNRR